MHRPVSLGLASLAFALVTSLGSQAAAQGTMAPSQQPPPLPPAEPAATPTQPPPRQPPPPPPATSTSEPPPEEAHKGEAPPARTGFQIALRTGVSVPLGELDKGENMSDAFTPQWPIIADIGFKVIPQLFLGGYVGIAVGGAGDTFKKACDAASVDCIAVGGRIGLQAQFHFIPDGKWNPWVGYGIGYELAGVSGSKANNKVSAAVAGVEFAHLMAGADFRVNKTVGIGPFADFAIGQYTIATLETTLAGVSQKRDGDIQNTALHEWLTLGVKITFFP
jgi:hypothetical protein